MPIMQNVRMSRFLNDLSSMRRMESSSDCSWQMEMQISPLDMYKLQRMMKVCVPLLKTGLRKWE